MASRRTILWSSPAIEDPVAVFAARRPSIAEPVESDLLQHQPLDVVGALFGRHAHRPRRRRHLSDLFFFATFLETGLLSRRTAFPFVASATIRTRTSLPSNAITNACTGDAPPARRSAR